MDKKKYRKMIRSVRGWHHPPDFFITASVLESILRKKNDLKEANFLEIGIYHGRSFIPICHYFYDRIKTCYAFDLFPDEGQVEVFRKNLSRFLPEGFDEKVKIIEEDSLKLSQRFPAEAQKEKFIYCSVDGHHTYEHTASDLKFCVERIEDGGIILLDDVYQHDWPEVSNAMYDFLNEYKDFKVAFILLNKVILSTDTKLADELFDPALFVRHKINGSPVNVVKRSSGEDMLRVIAPVYDFIRSRF